MSDPLKHYPYKEDTWRWGIPEQPKRSWWLIAAVIVALVFAGAVPVIWLSDGWTTTRGPVQIPGNERGKTK